MNDKQKAEFKLMQEYAQSKNGKCLATEYVNSHTKYLWEDETGYQWYAAWYSLKNRGSWSMSAGIKSKKEKLTKYKIEDLQNHAISKNGKCLSESYLGLREKHQWQDSNGNEFSMTWGHVLSGQWSPFEKAITIGKLKRSLTTDEFRQLCKEKYNIELLSEEYTGSRVNYQFRDEKGQIFSKNWQTVLSTKRLQKNPSSLPETHIADFLNELNVPFEKNNRKVLNGKELDFYIPTLNLAIEFHGLKWHSYDLVGNAHRQKYDECKKLGIRLIQIFEHEWKDRKPMVKSFIKSALGKNEIKLDARKCNVIRLDKKTASAILNETHIQGAGRFDKCFALEFEGNPVMLITIGKHHRDAKKGPVLTRCVSINNVTVRGGLSRLCAHAFTEVGSFITWVDLRWSTGDSWVKYGWKMEQEIAPDYFYYNENTKKVISKQCRRKAKVNTPEGMTESEHAKLDGLKTIKDAGKVRLTYNP